MNYYDCESRAATLLLIFPVMDFDQPVLFHQMSDSPGSLFATHDEHTNDGVCCVIG